VLSRGIVISFIIASAPAVADAAVHLDHCVITLGGVRAVVDGTIAPTVNLHVTVARWQLGELVARDVVIDVHDTRAGLRACATAKVGSAALDACGTLTRTYSQVRAVTWRARAPGWAAHGTGSVTRKGQITAHAVFEAGGTVELDATGSVTQLIARGEMRGEGQRVPFTASANLVEGRLTSLVASVLGGEISVDPVTPHLRTPTDLAIHARGLELGRLLPARVVDTRGAGVLDGELAMRLDSTGASVISGRLQARTSGRIRVADTSWVPKTAGLEQRIASTLADFEYTHLEATLAPRGSDPDVCLAISGHGKTVPQVLDLVINLRGARDLAQRLVPHLRSSS
jgi:hypothetical protein